MKKQTMIEFQGGGVPKKTRFICLLNIHFLRFNH